MTLIIVYLVLLVALGAFEGWLLRGIVASHFSQRLQQREAVRRSVEDQQVQAMLAAQQLSLLAWKARHEMYDLARDERGSQFGRVTRHK